MGFGEAKKKLEQYANLFNRGVIPRYLNCVERAGGAQNIRSQWNQTNVQNGQHAPGAILTNSQHSQLGQSANLTNSQHNVYQNGYSNQSNVYQNGYMSQNTAGGSGLANIIG